MCWGDNRSGQLANWVVGDASYPREVPVQIIFTLFINAGKERAKEQPVHGLGIRVSDLKVAFAKFTQIFCEHGNEWWVYY